MTSIWTSFIPHHVAADILAHPDQPAVGREQRFDAVALFADVSGFTAISEAFAREGTSGAEKLTAVLNSYFDPMIDLITGYGGIVGKFGGDAITVLFPIHPDNSRQTAPRVTRRALQCALALQERMADYSAIDTPIGSLSLSMKIGLAAGPIFCTNVGDPGLRLEYIIAGSALDACADAEHHATQGEIIFHEDILPHAGEVTATAVAPPFHRLAAIPHPPDPLPLPPLPDAPPPDAVATVAAFIHPTVVRRLRRRQIAFINEHRKVTILFVRFSGFDYDGDTAVGDKLQTYLNQVIHIVHRYDGSLNKVDMGDKGSKYIILFGAPVAHEDDEERALRCALEIASLPEAGVAVGVNTGFVYAGQVGSARRQEYTVMGDAVNVAARLMQAAEDEQILVSQTTQSAAESPFILQPRPPLQAKGRTQATPVYALSRLRQRPGHHLPEPQYTLPMVGRSRELTQILAKWRQAQAGEGQVVGITGEAGMGKSRLAAEVIRQIGEEHGRYFGQCQSYSTNIPYHAWHDLLRGLLQINPDQSLAGQQSHLEAALTAVDPTLTPRLPLLGPALDLPLPDNDLTRALAPDIRKDSRELLIVDLIHHRARQRPLLIVIEDGHWLDPLSNDLLEAVARNLHDLPILLLTVYRPPDTERIVPQVRRLTHFTEFFLEPFSEAEVARLIQFKLADLFGREEEVAPALVSRIARRAEGNPFYVDELLNLVHDQGWDPTDADLLESMTLPDSLHSLIISRIDQLSEQLQTTLKVASVIGRLFPADWLWGSYPELGTPEEIRRRLSELGRMELTPLDKPAPELEYLFKHILTREVAYETLAVATRAMLHEQIGRFIEAQTDTDAERPLSLLAYHYGLSRNTEKQAHYFRRAAAAAQAAYANETAVHYYERLLPLLPEAEQSGIWRQLGQVRELTGNWEDAEADYRRALSLAAAHEDPYTEALCRHSLGALQRARGDYDAALTALTAARSYFAGRTAVSPLIDVLLEIGLVHWYRGDHTIARDHFTAARRHAQTRDDAPRLAKAMGNLALLHWSQEEYEAALTLFDACLSLGEAENDPLLLGKTAGNVGNVYLEQGNLPAALAAYADYLQSAHEIGYRKGISISLGNMGHVYLLQGEIDNARACYLQDLRLALSLGDRQGTAVAAGSVARAYLEEDDPAQAAPFLQRALLLARRLDIPYDLSSLLYEQGRLLEMEGKTAEAAAVYEEAWLSGSQVGNDLFAFEARLGQVRMEVEMGERDTAVAVQTLHTWLDETDDPARQALLRYQLSLLTPDDEELKQKAADQLRRLHTQTPALQTRRQYHALTGFTLPDPAPLPAPPPQAAAQQPDPDALLARLDGMVGEVG